MEIASLATSLLSILISVAAIALSIVFYRWAESAAEKSSRNLIEITSAVSELNRVVYGLRTESFDLVRTAQAGLMELASTGVRRVPDTTPLGDGPRAPSHPHDSATAEPGPQEAPGRAAKPKGVRPSIGERLILRSGPLSVEENRFVSEALGRHLMNRRGDEFPMVLAELRAKIKEEYDSAAPDTVLYPGQLLDSLGRDKYDIGEVVYALYTLEHTGDVADPIHRSLDLK